MRAKLEQSEKDLVAYAAQQQIIPLNGSAGNSPESARSLPSADLESYAGALTSARAERIRAQQRWLQAQAADPLDIPEVQQNPTIQELSKDRARLKAEYQDKLRRFKPDYPEMVQSHARIDEIDRQIAAEANAIRQSLKVQFQAAQQSEAALERQVSGLKQDVISLRGRSIQYNILQREVDTNRTLYDGLLQRYKEIGVVGAVAASNIAVVDAARPPKSPSSPKPLMNLGLGLIGGLLGGMLLAMALEIFDNAVRTPADVESKLGLAFLGAVPPLPKGVTPLEALADSRSPLSEAYFSLRAALQFSTVDGFPKSLLITSPWPGGGKSTTAFALAQNTARLGYRVLLIDADLRKPTQHTILNVENTLGLANLLTGEGDIEEMARATSLVNLHVIPSGVTPPNPAELLASDRFANLMARAKTLFDLVIIDGPPIMGLADAPAMAAHAAGVILIIQAKKTRKPQVQQALRRLGQSRAHLLGAVLTRYLAPRVSYGYGYGYDNYGYGYGFDYGREQEPALSDRILKLAEIGRRGRRLGK